MRPSWELRPFLDGHRLLFQPSLLTAEVLQTIPKILSDQIATIGMSRCKLNHCGLLARKVSPGQISKHIAVLSGAEPARIGDVPVTITSRGVADHCNLLTVAYLFQELEQLGLKPQRHCCRHRGRTLHSLVAEWAPGKSSSVIIAASLDSDFLRQPVSVISDELLQMITDVGAFDLLEAWQKSPAEPSAQGKTMAENAAQDAGGAAALLSIARFFAELPAELTGSSARHSLRLCFFNGEEEGQLGSFAYARACKTQQEVIVAALQLCSLGSKGCSAGSPFSCSMKSASRQWLSRNFFRRPKRILMASASMAWFRCPRILAPRAFPLSSHTQASRELAMLVLLSARTSQGHCLSH